MIYPNIGVFIYARGLGLVAGVGRNQVDRVRGEESASSLERLAYSGVG